MIKKIVVLFLMLLNLLTPISIYASQIAEENEKMLNEQLKQFDFKEIDEVLNGNENTKDLDFSDVIMGVIKGEIKISPNDIINNFMNMLFKELKDNISLMRNLLIICLLSAIITNLTNSFKSQTVSNLASYVSYTLLIILLFTSFQNVALYIKDVMVELGNLMEASIPLLMTLLVMSGTVGAPILFNPTLIFAVNVITVFISSVLTPLIIGGAAIQIINYLSEKEILSNFSGLVKKGCEWSLKITAFLFVSILSLQKIAGPIVQNFATKSAKAVIGSVPVLGDVLNGAWDMMFLFMGAIKSGVIIASVIVVVLICLFPIIKILSLILIFKVTAALVQPICDAKITKCINSIASYSFLLLSALTTVIVMFLMSVIILLSF